MNEAVAEVDSKAGDSVADVERTNAQTVPQEGAQRTGTVDEDYNLDELLSEFDNYQQKSMPQETGEQTNDIDGDEKPLTKADIDKLMYNYQSRQEYQMRTENDIKEAVSLIKGDSNIPDHYLRGILDMEAQNNPKFMNAFIYRDQKPQVWNKIVKAKAKEIQKYFGMSDSAQGKSMDELANQVNSAVRSATTEAPAPEKEMSNFEALQKYGPDRYRVWRKQQIARKGG